MNSIPKRKRITDRTYLRWIKTQPCSVKLLPGNHECAGPMDPHHSTPVSLGGSDYTAIPLCRKHHDELQSSKVARPWMLDRAEELVKEFRKLHPVKVKERRKSMKVRMYVGLNVRNCSCHGGHTIPLSKIVIRKTLVCWRCPVNNREMSVSLI